MLTRENSIGWVWEASGKAGPLGNPVPGTIRQIAFELVESIEAFVDG